MAISKRADFNFSVKDGKSTLSYQVDLDTLHVTSFQLDKIEYTPLQDFRVGGYGAVHTFTNTINDHRMVVKTPRKPVSEEGNRRAKCQKEIDLLEKVNAELGMYAIHFYTTGIQDTHFAYAMFMPYFPDMDLEKAIYKTSSEQVIIAYLLATAMELERIHKAGIIHNDVKGNNFRVDTKTLKVRAIDFYHATDVSKEEKVVRDHNIKKGSRYTYVASELGGFSRIKESFIATPASDTFSFGAMLCSLISHSISWYPTENKDVFIPQTDLYPGFIWKFQDMARSSFPDKRPTLKSFIDTLEKISTTPRSINIHYVFSAENFPDLQLKIGGKLYSPTESFTSESGNLIEFYDTPLGKLKTKYEQAYGNDLADATAIPAILYPEKLEDLNRPHNIKKHPLKQAHSPYAFFTISRYINGISLDEYMGYFFRQSALKQLRVLIALLRALNEVHDKGYIIMNLKVENIIINDSGNDDFPTVKFINFNWAYRLDAPFAKSIGPSPNMAVHLNPLNKHEKWAVPSTSHDDHPLIILLCHHVLHAIKDTTTYNIMNRLTHHNYKTVESAQQGEDLNVYIKELEAEQSRLEKSATQTPEIKNE